MNISKNRIIKAENDDAVYIILYTAVLRKTVSAKLFERKVVKKNNVISRPLCVCV